MAQRGMVRSHALSWEIEAMNSYDHAAQSLRLAATKALQPSGGLPCFSIFSKTAYGSDLLPAERKVRSSLTQANTMTLALAS